MDKEWLKYCATDEQLQTFNDEGYLIVRERPIAGDGRQNDPCYRSN